MTARCGAAATAAVFNPESSIQDYSGLTPFSLDFYPVPDGSRSGSKRERGEGTVPEPAAAPATVSGERSVRAPLGFWVLGRRRNVKTREPGDLPSAVVIREHCRSGCTDGSGPIILRGVRGTKFAVTCQGRLS